MSTCRKTDSECCTSGPSQMWGRLYTARVPLDGHWARINTPIRAEGKRNVRVVSSLLALVVAGATASLVAGLAQSPSYVAPPAGCIDVQIAGVMGSERFHPCGTQAIEA